MGVEKRLFTAGRIKECLYALLDFEWEIEDLNGNPVIISKD